MCKSCKNCNRCWFDNSVGLYMCSFWSSDEELVSVDCVPSESFDENRECYFAEKTEVN